MGLRPPGDVAFTRYWIAETLLALGQEIFMVAVGWQIYDLTGSALALGLIGLAHLSLGLLSSAAGALLVIGVVTLDFLEFQDVFSGLVKAAVFGFLITLMGCYHGYTSRGGAQGVGQATTNAVVSASALILTFNYFITEAFFSIR